MRERAWQEWRRQSYVRFKGSTDDREVDSEPDMMEATARRSYTWYQAKICHMSGMFSSYDLFNEFTDLVSRRYHGFLGHRRRAADHDRGRNLDSGTPLA